MFYTVAASSMACLYAYTPNVPSNVYECHWFCSCKCNVLINPPSKTSSCQAVSIIWSECQQAPILRSVISGKCRTAYWLGKGFSVWWKWANHMFWGISLCNWMWYLSYCLMECEGRCLNVKEDYSENKEILNSERCVPVLWWGKWRSLRCFIFESV